SPSRAGCIGSRLYDIAGSGRRTDWRTFLSPDADSALEGSGFEPSVPLPRLWSIRAVRAEIIGRSTDVFRRDREFDVSALQRRLSTSSQSQCSTDPGLIAGTWHRPLFLTRDRWFGSGSLHR